MAEIAPWIAGILVLLGGLASLLAAVGLLRLPDFYLRLHAATKASTLGLGLFALAFVVGLGTLGAAAQSFVLILFVFLTAPVVAHVLGRAALRSGVPFLEGTVFHDSTLPESDSGGGPGSDSDSGTGSDSDSDSNE